jgi:Skp family chaperone for outer membrane proteins
MRNQTVLKQAYIPAPSKSFVPSSGQPSAERRRFAKATIAFVTLAVAALVPATVFAQQAASAPTGHRIAVIDVGYIFKNLPEIKAQISKVEADLKKDEAELKQKREALKQAVEQLKTLKIGTADYAKQEEYVANLESKLRLNRSRKQNQLRGVEAKIYFDNYQRIAAAVKAIATHNNIKLVLRFNSEDMDLEQNDSVARGVMKNVVYQDSTINITDTVIKYLERQTNTAQVATGGNAASATQR